MSGGGGFATSPVSLPGHRTGSGPDSIYVHAVAPKAVAGGPVALCGYPLRASTLHARTREPGAVAAETFEDLARTSANCCPECRAALALEALAGNGADADERPRAWVKWAAISLAAVTSLGGLIGAAIAVAQRF
jgi:hypothetical protein